MVAPLSSCPVCGVANDDDDPATALATHLAERAAASDGRHVTWLNRTLTRHRADVPTLARLLRHWATTGTTTGQPVRR